MKVYEEISVTNHHFAPVGSPIKCPRVQDVPVTELIDRLKAKGIEIAVSESEVEVTYQVGGKENNVTVPLGTTFPGVVSVQRYVLVNSERNLELELSDYDDVQLRPNRRVIGGSIGGNFGIVCKLTYTGEDVSLKILEDVRSTLQDTYKRDIDL